MHAASAGNATGFWSHQRRKLIGNFVADNLDLEGVLVLLSLSGHLLPFVIEFYSHGG